MLVGVAVKSEEVVPLSVNPMLNIKNVISDNWPILKQALIKNVDGERRGWEFTAEVPDTTAAKKFITETDVAIDNAFVKILENKTILASDKSILNNMDSYLNFNGKSYKIGGYVAYKEKLKTTFKLSEDNSDEIAMGYYFGIHSQISNKESCEKFHILFNGSHEPLFRFYEKEIRDKDQRATYMRRVLDAAKELGLYKPFKA